MECEHHDNRRLRIADPKRFGFRDSHSAYTYPNPGNTYTYPGYTDS
jgi:hypothetical protein